MNTIEIKNELEKMDSQIMVKIARRCFKGWETMRDTQEELYYYTDMNALVNGIFKYDDKICLWASRWSHVNDPQEVKLGLEELANHDTPDWAVDDVLQSLKTSHSISFSGYNDILPMWKMYGDGGTGAMLAFNTKILIEKWGGLLQPCIYRNTSQFETTKEALFHPESHLEYVQLSSIQRIVVWFQLIQMFASVLKSDDYYYENEVRVVGLGNIHFDEKREQKYRISDGKIIPYVEAFMPKDSLKGVCLGPLVDSSNKEIIEEFLHNKGYNNVVVTKSKIHYR